MNHKKLLALVFILAFILRITFAFITPVFEKPDEKPHLDYIQFVADNKKLPVQESRGGEFFQPPFYHVFVSLILKFTEIFTENGYFIVTSLRFLSVMISMFTLYFTYKIASMIFKDKNLVLGIVAFASFVPSHINMNSTITNSNFANFLTTLIIYLLIKIVSEKEKKDHILLLGIISGIAMITRISLIPIILAIPFTFLVKYYPDIRQNFRKILKSIIFIGLIALAISSWNFVRNYELYGDFLGVNAMRISSPPDEINVDSGFVARLFGWTFVTFWASFGRTNGVFVGNLESGTGISIFMIFYVLLLFATLISFYGLFSFIKKYAKNRKLLNDAQKRYFTIAGFHLVLLLLAFISFNLYDFQPQGRLFFPAISTIAILFTFGFFQNFKQGHWKKLSLFYIAFFLLIDIASIAGILLHY